jgi:[acyl-carrier-protein] S-malonyltransferase
MFDILGLATNTDALLTRWALQDHLPIPLNTVLADGTALFSNRLAQPLIVAATLAAWNMVRAVLPAPALVAGYSVGELSAYAVAGAFSPADALALAAARAGLMDECALHTPPQALLAVTGLGLDTISVTAARCGMSLAIKTGPDSGIVGGLLEQARECALHMAQAGGRASLLPVSVASHTALMSGAVAPFAEALRQCELADPAIPVVAGLDGALVRSRHDAVLSLARQIGECIRWKECMECCAETGVTIALELGPGSALSRMLRQRHPQIDCRSIDDFRSVDGIARWIARHLDQ